MIKFTAPHDGLWILILWH